MSVEAGDTGTQAIAAGDTRTQAILAERARALARPQEAEETGRLVPLVVFGLGGQPHAVEACYVREVLRRPVLSGIPSAPPALVGVANVRGEILVVADISTLVAVPTPAADGPILVLDGPGPSLGVLVDGVHDFVEVPADSVAPVPNNPSDGPPATSLLLGFTPAAAVLSAVAVLDDPRLSTTDTRSGR